MASSRRQRRQRTQRRSGVLLGCVGALLAGLVVYQVFFRSSDAVPPVAAPPAVPSVNDSTTTTLPLEPTLPNVGFDDFTVRDPFEPVISTGGGSTGTTTTTLPTSTTTGAGGVTTTTTTLPAQDPTGRQDVELVDVTVVNGVQTARVRVATAEYTVIAGQAFAGNYQLVSFDGATCANFSHADSPFRLCVGEQVLK